MEPNIHYRILEIEPGASQAEIKQAYKDLAKVWHPDRFSDDPRLQQKVEEKLKQINAAYEFLKSYQSQAARSKVETTQRELANSTVNCGNLENLLKSGNLKAADYETKRLLLEFTGREKDGWLRPEDIKSLSPAALLAVDQLWANYSNGRFGLNIQSRVWHKLGCNSSNHVSTQTISENKFGQHTRWRVGDLWLGPWDSFNYDIQAPLGSLPRDYIFTLSGWWSYSKGWTGHLLWRFDEIFLKLHNPSS